MFCIDGDQLEPEMLQRCSEAFPGAGSMSGRSTGGR